jgi:hypothetical protein
MIKKFCLGGRRQPVGRGAKTHACELVAATCVAALLSSSASATVLVATYQVTIDNGTDGAGLFGAAGGNLAGDVATVTYTYDTSVGVRSTKPGFYDSLSSVGAPSIYRSVTISINNKTLNLPTGDVSANHENAVLQYEPGFVNTTYVDDGFDESDGEYLSTAVRVYNPPASIETPFSGSGVGSSFGGGALYGGGLETSLDFYYGGTVDVALAAPEPRAWLLMVVGLGGLGAAMRDRRARSLGAT